MSPCPQNELSPHRGLRFSGVGRLAIVTAALLSSAPRASLAQPAEARTILERFAKDYERDPSLTEAVTFGIRVDGDWWHIEARPASETETARVTVREGEPPQPTFFFFTDLPTLRKLDLGALNARTAMGKARASDAAPLDIDPTEGFVWTDDASRTIDAVANHFFLRGQPEIIPFDDGVSRIIHGAHAVLLHYERGLRSVWYQIDPGQHVNEDEADQTNPFPSLFIFLEGRGMARVGGVETEISGGRSVLVPEGVRHEFWNPFDGPWSFLLVMFGKGA